MEFTSIEKLYSIYRQHPIISKDSRDIPEGCIYVALRGDHFDGNQFALDALNKGAAYAIVDQAELASHDRMILVQDSLKALQELAIYHRQQLKIPILGITGSNGKTTSKELISAVLMQRYKLHFTPGNYNNHIGVPLTILQITDDIEMAVIEMGANHQGEIDFLCQIAQPNYGLITNIGKAHLEGFGGVEGIKKGKSELYRFLDSTKGTVFINADDQVLASLLPNNTKAITYGKDDNAYCKGQLSNSHPIVKGNWACLDQEGEINSPLYGEYNFYNLLAAICIGNYFYVDARSIDHAISSYSSEMNRSQLLQQEDYTVYLDAYNANPTSMSLAIDNFERSNHSDKVAIIGDMFELGEDTFDEHYHIVQQLKKSQHIQLAVVVGHHFCEHQSADERLIFLPSTNEAVSWFKSFPKKNKAFLIKGSRGMKMETILQ